MSRGNSAGGGKRCDTAAKERARASWNDAVNRLRTREAAAQIASYWRQDHEEMEGPQVFCPVALKWVSRADWEAQCLREAAEAKAAGKWTHGHRSPPRLGPGLEIEYVR